MTPQQIKELAGHRPVPPWVMKLVGDAIAIEREACAKVCDEASVPHPDEIHTDAQWSALYLSKAIRARGQK